MKSILEPFRQLALIATRTFTLRRLLLNRITLIVVVTILIAGGANGYVAANNDGNISGHVVDPDGEPVEDATVHLWPIHLQSTQEERTTTTDENGNFEFTDQTDVLEFRIQASKDSVGSSEDRHEQLHFQGQNTELHFEIKSDG